MEACLTKVNQGNSSITVIVTWTFIVNSAVFHAVSYLVLTNHPMNWVPMLSPCVPGGCCNKGQTWWLETTDICSHSPRAWTFEIKVWAGSCLCQRLRGEPLLASPASAGAKCPLARGCTQFQSLPLPSWGLLLSVCLYVSPSLLLGHQSLDLGPALGPGWCHLGIFTDYICTDHISQ